MLKRNHVLLVSGLVAVASNSLLCGADDGGSIKFIESQRIAGPIVIHYDCMPHHSLDRNAVS